ncbi:MAG TPA: class I SAM-dependent methyltransferase [Jatrophihabitantaceae bacterium]
MTVTLNLARWAGSLDDADRTVLDRCVAPVLDVGCGPGRFVLALAEQGQAALGVDITPAAVQLTQRHGAPALHRDVFVRTPGEGRWPTALLMDGNVGIGGDPERLFTRLRKVITNAGQVLVEIHPDPGTDRCSTVRFSLGGLVGPPFPWAEIGRTALDRHAQRAGYVVVEDWSVGGRSFAVLRPARSRATRTA